MRKMMLPAAVLAATIALAPTTAPRAAEPIVVKIRNMHFVPDALAVAPGAPVPWVNEADMPHTVTTKDGAFRSAALDTNERFSHTFAGPGKGEYYYAIRDLMEGRRGV